MDDLDRAEKHIEMELTAQIRVVRSQASEKLPFVRFCLNCGEPTQKGARWCCPECRDDWEKARRAKWHQDTQSW